MSQYWSQLVHNLNPYVPGEQPRQEAFLKLNTNENPFPPSPRVAEVIRAFPSASLSRYPDPESVALRASLASYHGLSPDQVFVGNGSDEVLAHSFQAFFKHPRTIYFPDISYSFYPVYCALYEINYRCIELNHNFVIDPDDYSSSPGGIIIPNPNAPTGIAMSLQDIEQLLQQSDSVVIIDEAYVDFGAQSATTLIDAYDNLLVIQTFSKSRSLAGLRLGYALGHRDLIDGLMRVKNSFNSYPVDRIAQVAAIASIEDQHYFEQCRDNIITNREWLTSALRELEFDILPSQANFLFVRHVSHTASQLYNELKQAGILVRHFDSERIENYLRISIGTDNDCHQLVSLLKNII